MGRLARLLTAAAILTLAPPIAALAQDVPPPAKSIGEQHQDVLDRAKANSLARLDAAKKCDLDRYRSLVQELSELLNQSNRLVDASRTTPSSSYYNARTTNDEIRRDYNDAIVRLQTLEEECRKKQSGDTPPPPPPPPPADPPPTGFEELWPDAAAAFTAHYGYAMNCNLGGMRAERAKLEILARDAEKRASKLRRRAVSSGDPGRKALADRATLYAKAIEALWRQALAQPPLNCPKTALEPPPPAPPAPPAGGSQDCPVPGTPGGSAPGKTPPEHGMRFTPPDQNSQRMLAAHNRARAEAGVPPLTWDRELAAGAASHATQMSSAGRVHAPRAGRKCVRENLLQSLRGGRSPEQMVSVWVSEKAYFKPGIFPNVSTTGNWAKVGHYTQVIWSTTTHLGCAVHSDARYDWTVCRYTPPGNIDGKSVLAFPPVSKQPMSPQPVPLPYPTSPPKPPPSPPTP